MAEFLRCWWRCLVSACRSVCTFIFFFFFQAEDGIREFHVTGVQTCALPILKVKLDKVPVPETKVRFPAVPPLSSAIAALRSELVIVTFGVALVTTFQLASTRSEEHTSELQSRENLVCRLLLEKKKKKNNLNT